MKRLTDLSHAALLLKFAAKEEGVAYHAGKTLSAVQTAANRAAERVAERHPLAAAGIKMLPAAALATSGYLAYQSDPVQRAINRYRLWRYNRAVRKSQGY